MIKGPCKDCPDRTTGDRVEDCHITCERYAAFRAAKDAENAARRDANMCLDVHIEGTIRTMERNRQGHHRRWLENGRK